MKRVIFVLSAILLSACVSKSEFQSAQSRIVELEAQVDSGTDEIRALEDQVQELESDIEVLEADRAEAVAELAGLEDDYADLQTERNDLNRQVLNLSRQVGELVCAQQISDMKYENILDASTIMAAWWARQPDVERVQGTYRDTIWSNADTKIHAVRYISLQDNQPYVEHFLVYFLEFSMSPGVFWVGGQCWLDAP